MVDIMYSNIIEPFEELDKTHCVLVTNVPKVSGSPWTFDGDIESSTTTRLYLNSSGAWTITGIGGREVACAAASAATNDVSGSIYVYPTIRIGAMNKHRDDQSLLDVGSFLVVNKSPTQLLTNKVSSESFAVGNQIYWDWTNGVATKVGTGYGKVGFESAITASPSGSSQALVDFTYPYYEGYARQLPYNIRPIELPKVVGDKSITDDGLVAMDISGNYFGCTAFSAAPRHGIYDDFISLETPATSGNTFIGYEHGAETKFYTNNNLNMSIFNPEFVYIVPTFGHTTLTFYDAQDIYNSISADVHENPTAGGVFNDTIARIYQYRYLIRKYRLIDEFGGLYNKRSFKPNIHIDVPSGLTWTRTPSSDNYVWSPPGPVDQSETHRFILTGNYNTPGQPFWRLCRKEPLTAAASSYYETHVNGSVNQPITYHNFTWFSMILDQDGDSIIDDYYLDPGYAVDLNKKWKYGCCQLEGGTGAGTGRVSHRFVRINADLTETELVGWTDMTRTPFYSYEGTDYIKFTGEKSLADLGITDPLMYYYNIRMYLRYYYISIKPYTSSSCLFGQTFSFSSNYRGSIRNYNPDNIAPFPMDIYPMAMKTSQGDEISTDFFKGYHSNAMKEEVSWSGGLTHQVTSVGGQFYTVGTTSTLSPSLSNTDLYSAAIHNTYVMRRIRRLSDGLAPFHYFTTKTTHGGIVWSDQQKPTYISPSNITYGTGKYSQFPVNFKLGTQLIDIAPNKTTEDYEIETVFCVILTWHNRVPTYVTYRDVQTVTI